VLAEQAFAHEQAARDSAPNPGEERGAHSGASRNRYDRIGVSSFPAGRRQRRIFGENRFETCAIPRRARPYAFPAPG